MTVILYIMAGAMVFVTCVSFYFKCKEKALKGVLSRSPNKCRLCGGDSSVCISHDSNDEHLEVRVTCSKCGATISRDRGDVYRVIEPWEIVNLLESAISAWNGTGSEQETDNE